MPDWLWVIFLFLALSIGYVTGFTCGSLKSETELNACPSEEAYIREAEIVADANKEIEIRKAEIEYQLKLDILKSERAKQKCECASSEHTE